MQYGDLINTVTGCKVEQTLRKFPQDLNAISRNLGLTLSPCSLAFLRRPLLRRIVFRDERMTQI